MMQGVIQKLVSGEGLKPEEARAAMEEIMSGRATPAQIAAFLVALRMKGETVTEITEFAKVMREFSVRINPRVGGRIVDTCGTGGDASHTINVSTVSALVSSAAGAVVAKHGNRAVSSSSGSADVLEALGVNIQAPPEVVQRCIEDVGIGFLFAPTFHPAMKNALAPRREIGVRTVFNILGPLTNPAGASAQLLGVYSNDLLEKMAEALKRLGVMPAAVVHGSGLDEITNTGETDILWISEEGEVSREALTPEELGVRRAKLEELKVRSREEGCVEVFKLLYTPEKVAEAKRDIVLLNSAAVLVVAGEAQGMEEGMEMAREALASGRAYQKLKGLVKSSGGDPGRLEELESKA